jgi:integrase
MKLTQKAVDALQLGGKADLIVFDDELKGFGVRLRVGAGAKRVVRSWVVQWKRGRATRRRRLGSAEVLSAAQARKAARKVLAKVDLGEDVQASRRERQRKDAHTLIAVAAEYVAAKKPDWAPHTFLETERYLVTRARYFGPLHRQPIDTITKADVAGRIVVIKRESGNAAAKRARAALSACFAWAMRQGVADANPCIDTDNPKITARDRELSPNELRSIWRACQDDDHGRIVRLLILLGARRQEIGGLAWSELDLEVPSWTLPKERSKNKRKHTLPLMPLALGIIQSVPRMVSRDLVFGSRNKLGFSSWAQGKAALDQRSGVTGWVIHDIRRSVATGMADIGVAPHIIEQILNHVSGHKSGVAGIYNRSSYKREVPAALALWEDHIRALIAGGEKKVIAFPQSQSA